MVSPLLFVGERMARFEHVITDVAAVAVTAIRQDVAACVPSFEVAAAVLRALGADEDHITRQLHWAQTGSLL